MENYKIMHGFYLRHDEDYLVKQIIPEYFIEQDLHSNLVNGNYAINFLQNELNSILNSFINGGFSYKGFILYPLVKDISKENLDRIIRLEKVAVLLNSKGYDFSDSLGKCRNELYRNKLNCKTFASLLSSLYEDFSKIKNKNAVAAKKPACGQLIMEGYPQSDSKYLKPLRELKKYADNNLKQYLSGFYLHGSLATKDYIKGWSDADTVSIISKETICNPKALIALREKMYLARQFFYKIDPLQHHGSIIISGHDLESYCNAYFPIPVFSYAKSFFEKDEITGFKVRDYSGEALLRLFWFVSYFRKLNTKKNFSLGSYELKTLLHSITLFPSLYLQSKGILLYKKFSFDIARKDFGIKDWKVIDEVSSIRRNWRGPISMSLPLFSKINPLFYYQAHSRFLDLFKNIKKQNKINEEQIIKGMHKLSEIAWENTKKNYKEL